jgi:hypothetical protein
LNFKSAFNFYNFIRHYILLTTILI